MAQTPRKMQPVQVLSLLKYVLLHSDAPIPHSGIVKFKGANIIDSRFYRELKCTVLVGIVAIFDDPLSVFTSITSTSDNAVDSSSTRPERVVELIELCQLMHNNRVKIHR